MLKILLIGRYENTFVYKFLEQINMYVYFSTMYADVENVNNCMYCIVDMEEDPKHTKTLFDVIIFKNNFFEEFDVSHLVSDRAIAILNSENVKAIKMLKKYSINSITCGLHENDTITASSISDDSVTVCIQRKVCKIGIGAIEAQEYNIRGRFYPNDIYPILAGSFLRFLI